MRPLIGVFVAGRQTCNQRGKEATNEQLSRQTYGESITKPPLLQRSRLTGGGSPNLVGLVERKAL